MGNQLNLNLDLSHFYSFRKLFIFRFDLIIIKWNLMVIAAEHCTKFKFKNRFKKLCVSNFKLGLMTIL